MNTSGGYGNLTALSHRMQEIFGHWRLMRLADLEGARADVPLHCVAEQVRQQEQALLGSDREIDVNLRSVQIAGQRIGNVQRHHTDAISPLHMLLHPGAVFCKRQHPKRQPTSSFRTLH